MKSDMTEHKSINSRKLTAWYDLQAPLYHFWRDSYDGPLIQRILAILRQQQRETVLDAGCGSGLISVGAAVLMRDCRFIGVDLSRNLLRIAKKEAARRDAPKSLYYQGDVTALALADETVSAVVAAGLLPNLNAPDTALKEFHRVLNKSGELILVEFDRQTMSLLSRVFFNVMIMGYHVVTFFLRKYRFAAKWDISRSTIDIEGINALVRKSGFLVTDTSSRDNTLVIVCQKQ